MSSICTTFPRPAQPAQPENPSPGEPAFPGCHPPRAGALSEAGQKFLEQMPMVEVFMPALELEQAEALLLERKGRDYDGI